jgi:hypothetical protein
MVIMQRTIFLAFAWLLWTGCAGTLHDAERAELSKKISEDYEAVDVATVVETEKENLDRLLAEDLRVVRENQEIQRDLAILELADSATPVGATLAGEGLDELVRLGFPAGIPQARRFEEGRIERDLANREWVTTGRQFQRIAKTPPPDCDVLAPLPTFAQLAPELPEGANVEGAKRAYRSFEEACREFLAAPGPPGGELAATTRELEQRRARLDELRSELAKARGLKDEADAEIGEATDASQADPTARLRELAKKVGLTEKRIGAIVTLLSRAAADKARADDPETAEAAKVAEKIPSLKAEMDRLSEGFLQGGAKPPSIGNLLIALRHQTIRMDHYRKLIEIEEQDVALLEAELAAQEEEVAQWRRFGDALCSFAYLSAGRGWPDTDCDSFRFDPRTRKCFAGSEEIPDCGLDEPWYVQLRREPGLPKRELYKALGAYLRTFTLRAESRARAAERVDLIHRRTLVTRETAIRSWNNLVAVPIDQLEAYYGSGIRPKEIADLLVKAVGFIAVAVGLSL